MRKLNLTKLILNNVLSWVSLCNSTLSCFARNLIENLKTSIISNTHSSGSVTDLPGRAFPWMHPFLGDKWEWRGIESIPSPNVWIWWNGIGDRKSASDASLYKPGSMYFWKDKKFPPERISPHYVFLSFVRFSIGEWNKSGMSQHKRTNLTPRHNSFSVCPTMLCEKKKAGQ